MSNQDRKFELLCLFGLWIITREWNRIGFWDLGRNRDSRIVMVIYWLDDAYISKI